MVIAPSAKRRCPWLCQHRVGDLRPPNRHAVPCYVALLSTRVSVHFRTASVQVWRATSPGTDHCTHQCQKGTAPRGAYAKTQMNFYDASHETPALDDGSRHTCICCPPHRRISSASTPTAPAIRLPNPRFGSIRRGGELYGLRFPFAVA
jgi:hypothetical protein